MTKAHSCCSSFLSASAVVYTQPETVSHLLWFGRTLLSVYMPAVSGVGEALHYWEKKNSALGSPCLVCFARPDTWKHHFLWSASICSHTTGVLLKVKSEKTTVSGVTLTSHPLVPSSYRVVQLLFMPEALPQLKAWTHICSYNRYLVLFNRYERFIMV